MIILSWNIQNGKGCDGIVSLERIADVVQGMCEPDVICLQEVTRGLSYGDDQMAPDQPAQLAELFSGYELVFGAAVDAIGDDNRRWQFGNLTLSRLPILSAFCHPLPQPAEPGIRHMPRQATEVCVAVDGNTLRVINTHLEFHSQRQRLEQIVRLRAVQIDVAANVHSPPVFDDLGPYRRIDRPLDCVVCGDFNMGPSADEYGTMLEPLPHIGSSFSDAWRIVHGAHPHDPTCGIFDRAQWPEGPHCRDYFFVAGDVTDAVQNVSVNTQTNASDHQPLLLELTVGTTDR